MRSLEKSPFELVFSVHAVISDADMNVKVNTVIAAPRSIQISAGSVRSDYECYGKPLLAHLSLRVSSHNIFKNARKNESQFIAPFGTCPKVL